MKKINLLLMTLFAYGMVAKAQTQLNFQWATVNKDNRPKSTVVDKNGNIYVAASFSATVDSDMTSGTTNFTTSNLSSFIAKYDANRNFLWAKEIRGDNARNCYDIYMNTDESSVYVLGDYTGTVYGDSAAGVVSRSSNGGADVYVAKFKSSNGALERISSLGTADLTEYPIKGMIDKNGNQYVLWHRASNGNRYLILTKINADNTLGYNFDMGTTSPGGGLEGFGLGMDSTNTPYISGYHSRQVAFKNTSGTYSSLNVETSGRSCLFIIKINNQGQGMASTQIKLYETNVVLRGFAVSKSGDVYMTGAHNLSLYPEIPGSNYGNIYLYHYNSSLGMTWATRILETGSEVYSNALSTDETGAVIFSGTIGSNTQIVTNKSASYFELYDTASHSKIYTPTTFSKGSTYLAKMTSNGDLAWFKQFSLQGNQNFNKIIVKNNDIYATGYTYGTFKPVPESNSNSEELGNDEAWYIIKYNQSWGVNVEKINSKFNNLLIVYPNPNQGILNIKTDSKINKIEIYNVNGVKEMEVTNYFENINVQHLYNGIYIMKVYSNNEILQTKLNILN